MFFFFKQKTAYEMRISDWSSDVCSSDLPEVSAIDKPAGFSAEFIACGEADRSCPSSEEVARIAGNIGGCHLLRAFAVAEIEIAQHAGEVTARPEDVGRVSYAGKGGPRHVALDDDRFLGLAMMTIGIPADCRRDVRSAEHT